MCRHCAMKHFAQYKVYITSKTVKDKRVPCPGCREPLDDNWLERHQKVLYPDLNDWSNFLEHVNWKWKTADDMVEDIKIHPYLGIQDPPVLKNPPVITPYSNIVRYMTPKAAEYHQHYLQGIPPNGPVRGFWISVEPG